MFHESSAEFFHPSISDHSPGTVSIFDGRQHDPPPYRFCSFWVEEPDFLCVVRQSWMIPMRGNPMMVLVNKLKRLKYVLIKWKNERFKRLFIQVEEAKEAMVDVQHQLQLFPLNGDLAVKEKEVVKHYARLVKYDESIAKEKSKVRWMDG